jgi:molecular chaperone GrpE
MNDETKEKNNDLEAELEKTKNQAQEYLDNWKRERAEFLNYKKDEAKRLSQLAKFANEGMIVEIIEILDNIEMAMKHTPEKVKQEHGDWLEGLSRSLKDFEELLKRYEVERIKTEGQKFDPALHEAINQEEGEDIEEIRAGYKMHDKVIRPARVKILSKN